MPPPKKKKTGLIIGIVLGVFALLVIGFVILLAVLGMSVEEYQEPVENWMEAIEENDVDMMYDTYYEDMWEDLNYTETMVKNDLQYAIDTFTEDIEDEIGDSYNVYPEYGDITEYDDERIEEFTEELEAIGVYGIEIEAAYEIEATLKAESDGYYAESDELTFVVVQVDGEWSIIEIRGLA